MILNDKNKRHWYMAQRLRMEIAYQIRLLRHQRELSQTGLAKLCGMEQESVAQIEDWDAPFPTLKTLLKVAKALDCALSVKLAPWTEVINSIVPSGVEQSEAGSSEPSAQRCSEQ